MQGGLYPVAPSTSTRCSMGSKSAGGTSIDLRQRGAGHKRGVPGGPRVPEERALQRKCVQVEDRYQGQEINTCSTTSLPVLEMALGGVLISGIENEEQAKRYLVESSLSKNENLSSSA